MKKIIYLAFILPLILYSCESEPEAMFSVETAEPEVGQKVFFTNESSNATSFEWNFGDGYGSEEENPIHIYDATGTYEVILTAFSKKGVESKATITMKVMVPTLLEIEVVEWYDEYVVPNASVILYPTLQTWEDPADDYSDIVAEGTTDKYGITVFAHLEPKIYYVDVWEENHDNYTLAYEDVNFNFIKTPEILPHKINRFTAWVDVADHGKGAVRSRDKSYVIKKLERKPDEKSQDVMPESGDDWKELFARSIKVK